MQLDRLRSTTGFKFTYRLLGAILGTFLYAAGMNLFIVPLGLYSGGVMGICQLLRTLLINSLHLQTGSFDIAGLIYYVISVPLMVLAFKSMGKYFSIKTLICMTTMTLFLSFIPIPQHSFLANDVLTSAIIGGIICGVGTGLTLMMGGSAGGMDILSLYFIKKKGNFSVGKINLLVNLVVYSICLLQFDIKLVLYSVVYAAAYSLATDKVHAQNINMEILIITKQDSRDLENALMDGLTRGITRWNATGEYTKESVQVLYVVLSKYEYSQLRHIVHKYDPHAFIVAKEHAMVEGHYLKKL